MASLQYCNQKGGEDGSTLINNLDYIFFTLPMVDTSLFNTVSF